MGRWIFIQTVMFHMLVQFLQLFSVNVAPELFLQRPQAESLSAPVLRSDRRRIAGEEAVHHEKPEPPAGLNSRSSIRSYFRDLLGFETRAFEGKFFVN